jgi:hypothetical protein
MMKILRRSPAALLRVTTGGLCARLARSGRAACEISQVLAVDEQALMAT